MYTKHPGWKLKNPALQEVFMYISYCDRFKLVGSKWGEVSGEFMLWCYEVVDAAFLENVKFLQGDPHPDMWRITTIAEQLNKAASQAHVKVSPATLGNCFVMLHFVEHTKTWVMWMLDIPSLPPFPFPVPKLNSCCSWRLVCRGPCVNWMFLSKSIWATMTNSFWSQAAGSVVGLVPSQPHSTSHITSLRMWLHIRQAEVRHRNTLSPCSLWLTASQTWERS